MNVLPPIVAPARPFLDWPIETDPARISADIALLGIPYSEPYPGDPWPNDQTRAPNAVRQAFDQFCGGTDFWDFDLGANLGSLLPAQCLDCGNAPWVEGNYDTYAAQVTEYYAASGRTALRCW